MLYCAFIMICYRIMINRCHRYRSSQSALLDCARFAKSYYHHQRSAKAILASTMLARPVRLHVKRRANGPAWVMMMSLIAGGANMSWHFHQLAAGCIFSSVMAVMLSTDIVRTRTAHGALVRSNVIGVMAMVVHPCAMWGKGVNRWLI